MAGSTLGFKLDCERAAGQQDLKSVSMDVGLKGLTQYQCCAIVKCKSSAFTHKPIDLTHS